MNIAHSILRASLNRIIFFLPGEESQVVTLASIVDVSRCLISLRASVATGGETPKGGGSGLTCFNLAVALLRSRGGLGGDEAVAS